MSTYTIISCHFGDPFWIRHTLAQVDRFSDERVERVVLVDQNRSDQALLRHLPRVDTVLEFPPETEYAAAIGHDHAAALNRALVASEVRTSHVIVLDSDCFPTRVGWLDRLTDVTLAADPRAWGLSHPCFMAFPAGAIASVDFADGLLEVGMDTGRLVALQLAKAGYDVGLHQATTAFRGTRGHFYLDGSIYHHGSASFSSASDPRLRSQKVVAVEEFYRHKVAAGEYTLTALEVARIKAQRRLGS